MHADTAGMHIVTASALAALITGTMAVLLSTSCRNACRDIPFPALLPMIPGIYAYKTFGGLILCLSARRRILVSLTISTSFAHNGMTCLFILLGMTVSATVPIFLLKRISFRATRDAAHHE